MPVLCTIVFWNVHRKDLTSLVCGLAVETGADVLILNECSVPSSDTLQALQEKVDPAFDRPESILEGRFHCFCRRPQLDLAEVHKGARTSVRRLCLSSGPVLLALVHGLDIRNYDSETRQAFAQELASDLRFVEAQQGVDRVLAIGDFNMNPFDRGMNLASGLNAMMTRQCIRGGYRTFQEKKYEFYYNPMWGLLGDRDGSPAGTVYDTSNQGPYGWNMLDQVIVKHNLVEAFEEVEILTRAGETSLVNANGRPDKKRVSDHLPIMVKLKGGSDA